MNKVLNILNKKCVTCKINQPVANFYKNKGNIGGFHTVCKECNKIRNKTRAKSSIENHLRTRHRVIRHKAKKRGLDFLITIDDVLEVLIVQQGLCAITKCPLTYIHGENRVYTNVSIDRIDSNKGYIKGNIQLVCDIVNVMKNSLTMDELYSWCNLIINNKIEKE